MCPNCKGKTFEVRTDIWFNNAYYIVCTHCQHTMSNDQWPKEQILIDDKGKEVRRSRVINKSSWSWPPGWLHQEEPEEEPKEGAGDNTIAF